MVYHTEIRIEKNCLKEPGEILSLLENEISGELLRWSISRVTPDFIYIEASVVKDEIPFKKNIVRSYNPAKQAVVSLIPTGIGCAIGGFAADAAPATSLLAAQVDYLITNPNAVNASNFINITNNVLYTEGYLLDRFMQGETDLYPVTQNKIGVIIEHTTAANLEVVYNIINTARAVHGVHIEAHYVTSEKIGSMSQRTASGAYVGDIRNPEVLFEACDYLIAKGCTAIAVTSNFEDLSPADYKLHFEGNHPNPVGGCEAIISHSIVRKYNVSCAHAPMINLKEMNLESNIVDARGAGEMASRSGLACVLIGLAKAPSPVEIIGKMKDVLSVKNVLAVLTPASSIGSIPVINALKLGIPVIAVKDNETIMDVNKHVLGWNEIIEVSNYLEATGVIQALKEGISIESLLRPLETLIPNIISQPAYSVSVHEA